MPKMRWRNERDIPTRDVFKDCAGVIDRAVK